MGHVKLLSWVEIASIDPVPFEWRPRIGDPSAWGWLTVAAYFWVAWACWQAAKGRKPTKISPFEEKSNDFEPEEQKEKETKLGPVQNTDSKSKVQENEVVKQEQGAPTSALEDAEREPIAGELDIQKEQSESQATEKIEAKRVLLWRSLFIVFLALGINKQLDLQSLLTEIGRYMLRYWNWYEQRRLLQAAFVSVVAVVLLGAVVSLAKLAKGQAKPVQLSLLGTTVLFGFICVRAASFHHVDVLLALSISGMRSNHIFELSGIAIVGGAAFWSWRGRFR